MVHSHSMSMTARSDSAGMRVATQQLTDPLSDPLSKRHASSRLPPEAHKSQVDSLDAGGDSAVVERLTRKNSGSQRRSTPRLCWSKRDDAERQLQSDPLRESGSLPDTQCWCAWRVDSAPTNGALHERWPVDSPECAKRLMVDAERHWHPVPYHRLAAALARPQRSTRPAGGRHGNHRRVFVAKQSTSTTT